MKVKNREGVLHQKRRVPWKGSLSLVVIEDVVGETLMKSSASCRL